MSYFYDDIADWYDIWYDGHHRSEKPISDILALIDRHMPPVEQVKVLDCACGTGNPYIALKKMGYDVIACDASQKMLAKTAENSEREAVDPLGIMESPVQWNELAATFGHGSFDLVLCTGNSLCHEPPGKDGVLSALQNMHAVLREDGLCVIDTKKYNKQKEELYFQRATGTLQRRTNRSYGKRSIPNSSFVAEFDTDAKYEYDPSGNVIKETIRLAISIEDEGGRCVKVEKYDIPFYPLPLDDLCHWMEMTRFKIMQKTYDNSWYDLVIGSKEC